MFLLAVRIQVAITAALCLLTLEWLSRTLHRAKPNLAIIVVAGTRFAIAWSCRDREIIARIGVRRLRHAQSVAPAALV